jgi:hypothetical protein
MTGRAVLRWREFPVTQSRNLSIRIKLDSGSAAELSGHDHEVAVPGARLQVAECVSRCWAEISTSRRLLTSHRGPGGGAVRASRGAVAQIAEAIDEPLPANATVVANSLDLLGLSRSRRAQ